MIKYLFLLLILVGCGKSSEETTSSKVYYAYGLEALPGSLSSLDGSYRPSNLSVKMISSTGKTFVPMDFKAQELTLSFDVATSTVHGSSVIQFEVPTNAYPYFELLNPISSMKLDGQLVNFVTVTDPEGQNRTYIGVDQSITSGVNHILEVEYDFGANKVAFSNGGIGFLAHMTDLEPSNYFETWGPVGFEEDAFALTLKLNVLNGSSSQTIFTNGSVTTPAPHEWRITFPDYFTRSSFYVHLTNLSLVSRNFVYHGIEKDIPVQIYGATEKLVNDAVTVLPEYFKEFEGDYGPYAHDSFTAYMHSSGGGMEYVGATITSLGALDHELFHSWFARGVMPADGRSGWIDEAFASWRDYGYFQAGSLLERNQTNLARFSAFRESTPRNCYVDGRNLVAELDRVFSAFGGMKPLMRSFFERYKRRVVTNEEFWQFLSSMSGMNIDAYFQRYTLGGGPSLNLMSSKDSKHPLPLSQEELKSLR